MNGSGQLGQGRNNNGHMTQSYVEEGCARLSKRTKKGIGFLVMVFGDVRDCNTYKQRVLHDVNFIHKFLTILFGERGRAA